MIWLRPLGCRLFFFRRIWRKLWCGLWEWATCVGDEVVFWAHEVSEPFEIAERSQWSERVRRVHGRDSPTMECCRGVARVCIQIVRWLPVCILMAAASWGYYAYVFQLTFGYMEDAAVRVLYLIGFHFLLVMFLWSYFSTVFAKLRSPPMNFFPPRELLDELSRTREDREASAMLERYCHENNIHLKTKAFEGGVRYCPKCRCLKPDRAHHCSVCGQCVLKFDHHCPWVNTCVSFDNYKFFILFLGYAFLFCLWVMLCDLPFFIEFWNRALHDKPVSGQFHLLFLFFVSGMFAISVSVLFFYHLYLTANNLTTVESFRAPILSYGPDKKAFHLGIRENYRQVFGSRPLLWFVPINTSEGDGCKAVTRVGVSDPCVSADLSGPAPSGPAPYSYSSSRVSASEMV